MKKVNSLVDRDKKSVWHPFTSLESPLPVIPIRSAEGVYLYTEEGEKILDAISSWWVNIHGHAHPKIAQAISDQAQKLEQVIFAGFTHEPAIKLAENLLNILPSDQQKVFYSDDGSTSVEVALKLAIQYWQNQEITSKKRIIAFDGAYHGDTFGAMSIGDRGSFTLPFAPYLFEVEFVDFPQKNNHDKLVGSFKDLAGTGEVAAFIFEPLVQGAAGMRMYDPDILDQLIGIAQGNEIICIADEVMTGFGRTGRLFASQYLENQPDLFCLSKGITGGTLPLGVTTCSQKIVEAFLSADSSKTFFHGHSYTANPLACAAANASYEILLHEDTKKNIKRISARHLEFANSLQGHKKLKDVRCLGTILALEIGTSGQTSYFNKVRDKIYQYAMNRGILIRPLGNVVYVMPPYVITDEQLDTIYDCLQGILEVV